MKKKIMVIGSLNMDMCIPVTVMPKVGETILANEVSYLAGGKGANQTGAAAKLGGDVTMLGCIGNDDFGDTQKKILTEVNANVSALRISESRSTGIAVIYVDAEGNNSIVVIAGANAECSVSYLKEQDAAFQACDYVLLQMEIPEESIRYATKRAKELGKIVILNPAPAPNALHDDILTNVDYLTPNETEVCKLAGYSDTSLESVKKAAAWLLAKGARSVLVTLGGQGSLFVNKEGETLYPARKVVATDTTAAGDCFNGAFVTALAEGKTEAEAIQFASVAASISVTRKGALQSIPTRKEVDFEKGVMI